MSQGEAFTLAYISYLAILVKYILAKKKKKEKKRKRKAKSSFPFKFYGYESLIGKVWPFDLNVRPSAIVSHKRCW